MVRKLILWILPFLFVACSNDEILDSKIDNYVKSQTRFVLIDTFSVELETVAVDSVETSSGGNLLAGRYNDPDLGIVNAVPYFELGLPEDKTIEKYEVYDSIVLVLEYSDLVYGDTLQPQTLLVKQLLEELDEGDDDAFYNTDSFAYSETELGSRTFIPRPSKDDTLKIRLSDELGLDLFNKLKEDEDEVSSTDDFKEYFKGLVLESGENNTAVLSFLADSLSRMEIHSHLSGLERTTYTYPFALSSSQLYFNHIKADRTGLPVDLVKTQRISVPSSQTENKSFIECGDGLLTRMNFPTIGHLLEFGQSNILYKAELVLRPYPGSQKIVPLPEYLVLYRTDKYNNLISILTDESSNTIYSTLYTDEFYNEYNYYSIDITDFLTTEISNGFIDENIGLIVTIPSSDFLSSLNRMVIDARSGDDYRPMLKLYYVFYE